MNRNGKFQRKDISSAGFVKHPDGVYRKGPPNRPRDNTKPQANKLERSPKKRTKSNNGTKKGGKEINSTGYVYQLIILSYRSRPIDASNCCPKYIEDTLVNEGFMEDDNIFFCPKAPIVHQIIGVPAEENRTEVFLFKMKKSNDTTEESNTVLS